MRQRNDELYHYGRKGMKWGQHIYGDDPFSSSIAGGQGGKATGTARLAANAGGVSKAFEPSIKKGKGKENASPAEEMSRNAKDAAYNGENAIRNLGKMSKGKKTYTNPDIHNMSDAELRNRINRIEMERKYSSLTEPEIESGWEKAADVLHVVGDIAAVALNVALFVGAVKKMKG